MKSSKQLLGAAAVASAIMLTPAAKATLSYQVTGVMNSSINMGAFTVNSGDAYSFIFQDGVLATFTSGANSLNWTAANSDISSGTSGAYFNFNALNTSSFDNGAGVNFFGISDVANLGSADLSKSFFYLDNLTSNKEVTGTVLTAGLKNPEVGAVPEASTVFGGLACVGILGGSMARRYFKKDSVNVA